MSVNFLGSFDDSVSKFKNMVILTSIIACINYCVDNGVSVTTQLVIDWVEEKTGHVIKLPFLEFALDFLLNQVNLFVVFTISESCEDLARNMLDNPSAISSAMRRFI